MQIRQLEYFNKAIAVNLNQQIEEKNIDPLAILRQFCDDYKKEAAEKQSLPGTLSYLFKQKKPPRFNLEIAKELQKCQSWAELEKVLASAEFKEPDSLTLMLSVFSGYFQHRFADKNLEKIMPVLPYAINLEQIKYFFKHKDIQLRIKSFQSLHKLIPYLSDEEFQNLIKFCLPLAMTSVQLDSDGNM